MVVHYDHPFQPQPDLASRDRLLEAIDARNAEIDGYYNSGRRNAKPLPGWSFACFRPLDITPTIYGRPMTGTRSLLRTRP